MMGIILTMGEILLLLVLGGLMGLYVLPHLVAAGRTWWPRLGQ
ncbi:hypothetical protein OB955_22235 [Halobacteria archaeon AArc-m2/3/4]|uniref:Uncharacterized protein n=1 Tax=Natronoglomus mannanivorans TaxID=2979990 RepID=A0AAP2YXZ8_9EURY|nr:hypothetical protein [Halobacteria archaeon AArc-xg1-1]MCU4975414.1 hypothetical protein [Halobacteria archaeon AArc-m2/3/4]